MKECRSQQEGDIEAHKIKNNWTFCWCWQEGKYRVLTSISTKIHGEIISGNRALCIGMGVPSVVGEKVRGHEYREALKRNFGYSFSKLCKLEKQSRIIFLTNNQNGDFSNMLYINETW